MSFTNIISISAFSLGINMHLLTRIPLRRNPGNKVMLIKEIIYESLPV